LTVLALAGCQGEKPPPPAEPVVVQAKDANGKVLAELRPLRPCRASVDGAEMIVGGPPILSQVGNTTWTGSTTENGTTYSRDGERIARVFPIRDPKNAAVLDMQGVAMARIAVSKDTTKATVADASSAPVRNLTKLGSAISIDAPPMTVTGTDDLVLAALLTAPELVPEVRMLAACERVLVKGS
jgi:hypothetical protein